jgi:hypothetical protein
MLAPGQAEASFVTFGGGGTRYCGALPVHTHGNPLFQLKIKKALDFTWQTYIF